MSRELEPFERAIQKAKPRFDKVASKDVNYEKECIFAMQLISKTNFALETANKNPGSVQLSMINVASTGLTLNPAHGYAYLVPRDGSIVLDISYKGLIKIATDTGSIMWARAEVVYERDQFKYHGPAKMPEHEADVFGDRGEIKGAYCIAKTKDGDILTETMPWDEIVKIRGKSMAYARKKAGPWVEWLTQMIKKAVIKRASKTWPYTDRAQELLDAIDMANETEGGYELEAKVEPLVSEQQASTIIDWIDDTATDKAELLALFDVESVEALPANRFKEVIETIKARAHHVSA